MRIDVPDPLFQTNVDIDYSRDQRNKYGDRVCTYTFTVTVGRTVIFKHVMTDEYDYLDHMGDSAHADSQDDAHDTGTRLFGEWLYKKLYQREDTA